MTDTVEKTNQTGRSRFKSSRDKLYLGRMDILLFLLMLLFMTALMLPGFSTLPGYSLITGNHSKIKAIKPLFLWFFRFALFANIALGTITIFTRNVLSGFFTGFANALSLVFLAFVVWQVNTVNITQKNAIPNNIGIGLYFCFIIQAVTACIWLRVVFFKR